MNDIKQYLLGRVKHAGKRTKETKEAHGNTPITTHNYYAGQTLGYWQGMFAAYQNALNQLEEDHT